MFNIKLALYGYGIYVAAPLASAIIHATEISDNNPSHGDIDIGDYIIVLLSSFAAALVGIYRYWDRYTNKPVWWIFFSGEILTSVFVGWATFSILIGLDYPIILALGIQAVAANLGARSLLISELIIKQLLKQYLNIDLKKWDDR